MLQVGNRPKSAADRRAAQQSRNRELTAAVASVIGAGREVRQAVQQAIAVPRPNVRAMTAMERDRAFADARRYLRRESREVRTLAAAGRPML